MHTQTDRVTERLHELGTWPHYYLFTYEITVPFVLICVAVQIPHNQPSISRLCDQFEVSKNKKELMSCLSLRIESLLSFARPLFYCVHQQRILSQVSAKRSYELPQTMKISWV